jgi:hypothetical protein
MDASHLRIVKPGERVSLLSQNVYRYVECKTCGNELLVQTTHLCQPKRSGVGLSWLNLRDAIVVTFVVACAAYLAHVLGLM